MPYVLGIDLGYTRTTAAVCRRAGGSWGDPEVVPLQGGARWLESILHVAPDGTVLAGRDARRRSGMEPQRIANGLLARVGDPVPLLLGGDRYLGEALAATLAGWVVDVVAEAEGGPADRLVLTHPPSWGPHRRGVLRQALDEAGLPGVLLLPGPVAAAEIGQAGAQVEPGSLTAVCRLGGEHVESATLRRGPVGYELLARAESGVLRAGAAIDDLLVEHVLAKSGAVAPDPADPEARAAMARVRAACTEAKERLSLAPDAYLPVPLPGATGDVYVSRAELEHLARPVLTAAITQLRRITAPIPADRLSAAVFVGGSARIPLLTELAEEALECRVVVDPDPGTALCRGAALAALPRMAPEQRGTGSAPDREFSGAAEMSTALAPRESGQLATPEDLGDLGDPPPRPPVEITPLEPPPKFAMLKRGRNSVRDEDRDEEDR